MLDTLLQHRTIRKYKATDVTDEQLNKIIEAGCRASTTGNMQVYSIIVNRDAKMKELLSGCHFNQPMVKNAPVVLTFAPISTALICGANSTTPIPVMTIFSPFHCRH